MVLLGSSMTFAASVPRYAFHKVDEQLTHKSDAILRYEEKSFIVESKSKGTLKVRKAITILNHYGDRFAPLFIYYDPQRKVKNIDYVVYDENGKEIKKAKNSEIEDNSAHSAGSLYDDYRLKFYEYNSSKYPYTVEYSYEIEFKGLFYYPSWSPVSGRNLAVEESNFSVTVPKDLGVRYKAVNFEGETKVSSANNEKTYSWQLTNYYAQEKEPLSPEFAEILPSIHLAPNDFEYEGYAGNMESWKSFGQWINKLNKGRDDLPLATQAEVRALVQGIEDEKEKIKKVYEYMQSKTRYVSIQLGIGGYQPFPASVVDEMGYGDCKALTNYTQSLLKAIGIESYYTLIRAGEDATPIFTDFPSTQFNHAILCVPVAQDTIWLECTDQNNPFGYLGYFTSDRDVLIVDKEGGKIAHTTSYSQEENQQSRKVVITLNEEGHGDAQIRTVYQGLQYAHISPILRYPQNEQEKIIYQKTSIPNFTLLSHHYEVKERDNPTIEERLEVKLEKYAQLSSKRFFFTPNLLNQMDGTPPQLKERKNEVVVETAFIDTDSITFLIPESMHPEYIPESTHIKNEFGEYSLSFEQEQGKIVFVRKFKTQKGHFPAEAYDELVKFYERIAQKDAQKIVLRKST